MRLIDADNAWGTGILQDWYIHSVSPDDIPQWTDKHIEELCNDFYVIPKETIKYYINCNLDRLKELAEADKEAIKQLASLIINSQLFHQDEGDIWEKDIEALRIAIEALKKVGKKSYLQQDEQGNDCLECPNCDSFIGYSYDCKDEHYQINYCPYCGQRIDWEE